MRSKIGIAAKRTFLKKGEGLARFGVRTKTVTEPVASKEHDKDIVEQKAPVTRKTATVKDYTTSKQSAMPRVTEAAVKPKSMAKTDQMQLDVRKLNASKSSTGRQTMSKLFYIQCILRPRLHGTAFAGHDIEFG